MISPGSRNGPREASEGIASARAPKIPRPRVPFTAAGAGSSDGAVELQGRLEGAGNCQSSVEHDYNGDWRTRGYHFATEQGIEGPEWRTHHTAPQGATGGAGEPESCSG